MIKPIVHKVCLPKRTNNGIPPNTPTADPKSRQVEMPLKVDNLSTVLVRSANAGSIATMTLLETKLSVIPR